MDLRTDDPSQNEEVTDETNQKELDATSGDVQGFFSAVHSGPRASATKRAYVKFITTKPPAKRKTMSPICSGWNH